jgi:hypothetical protein
MHAVRELRRAGVGVEAVEPVTVARSGDRTRTALLDLPQRLIRPVHLKPPRTLGKPLLVARSLLVRVRVRLVVVPSSLPRGPGSESHAIRP